MSKHTPGPWKCGYETSNNGLTGPRVGPLAFLDGESVCEFPIHSGDHAIAWILESYGFGDKSRVIADAKLIAAAPDLLEALQGLIDCISNTRGPNANEALELAHAAIEKATK